MSLCCQCSCSPICEKLQPYISFTVNSKPKIRSVIRFKVYRINQSAHSSKNCSHVPGNPNLMYCTWLGLRSQLIWHPTVEASRMAVQPCSRGGWVAERDANLGIKMPNMEVLKAEKKHSRFFPLFVLLSRDNSTAASSNEVHHPRSVPGPRRIAWAACHLR